MDSGKAKRGRKRKSTRPPQKRTKSKALVPRRDSNPADSLTSAFIASDINYLQLQAPSLLAAIVDSSDDAIVSKTLNGIITSWNKSAQRIFGYSAEEAIGSPITLIIPRDRWDEEAEIIRQIKRGERVDHFETIRARKDRSLLNVSVTISPVKDQSGRIVGASKVARDITVRRENEKALSDRARQQRCRTYSPPEWRPYWARCTASERPSCCLTRTA
jgi:PAS domain S-box-containing protein